MSRDIELVKRLSQEIGHEIEIRPQPRRDSPEYRKFAKERDALIQKLRSEPGKVKNYALSNLYAGFDKSTLSIVMAITDEDERVVRLYLKTVPLEEIPNALFELQSLEYLSLYKNRFRDLPGDIQSLTGLKALFCENNPKLRELPAELARLPQLVATHFWSLPQLSVPPQGIARQGIGAIRNYFASLEASESVDYLYEAKMVLVGRGFAGKASLVRKLTRPNYHLEEHIPSTEGIAIDTWDLKMPLENSDRFRFNIWDFAGQEKYDATHQFFITERTVYLFVTEARQESNYLDFDYEELIPCRATDVGRGSRKTRSLTTSTGTQ